jgi:hypothetical protein
MTFYRAYVIGSDGTFNGAHRIECEDDASAIEEAKQYVNGSDVEVWQQNRRITRLEHKQE